MVHCHDEIFQTIDRVSKSRRNIVILTRKRVGFALEIAQKRHRLIVAGDKFRPLLSMLGQLNSHRNAVVVETDADSLPIANNSVDVLIVTRPISKVEFNAKLNSYKKILKNGGLLLLVSQVKRENWRRFFSFEKKHIHSRQYICHELMNAGYSSIGQKKVLFRKIGVFVINQATVQKVEKLS